MTPHPRWLLGLLCCLPAAGCCSISQGMVALFCGASEDPWAKVTYRTPKEALRTFQAAVGREDVDVIYKSLSKDFKRRHGIGILEAKLAWQKIKEQIPDIHMVELAKVVATPIQQPAVVEYVLEVAFHRFRVRLKRYHYKSVVVLGPDPDQPIPHGDYLAGFSQHLQIRHRGEVSDVRVDIADLEIEDLQDEDIIEITLGREWKVDLFEPVTENKK